MLTFKIQIDELHYSRKAVTTRMHKDIEEYANDYNLEIRDSDYDDNWLVVKGESARLFYMLSHLSFRYDIEII